MRQLLGYITILFIVCSHPLYAQTVYFPANGLTVAGSASGQSGSMPNQLASPNGIFVDDTGNLYVADQRNSRVQKWRPGATTGITVAGGNGFGDSINELWQPYNCYVDKKGDIYIADGFNDRIQEWLPGADSGITVAGGHGSGPASNQITPEAVWVDKEGSIYVSDAYNRIQKWIPGVDTGITVAGGHSTGNAANQFNTPGPIYVDSNHNIYVCDEDNARVQKWKEGDSVGITVAGGHGVGYAANQLDVPQGISVDSNGNLYIADGAHNSRIQKWAPGADSGITVAGTALPPITLSEFKEPSGVFIYKNVNLFVSDNGNNRVLEYKGHYPNISVPEVGSAMSEICIYPNPATDILHIDVTTNEHYSLLDIVGKVIQQGTLHQGSNTVSVQWLPEGMYLLALDSDEGWVIRKVLKQ